MTHQQPMKTFICSTCYTSYPESHIGFEDRRQKVCFQCCLPEGKLAVQTDDGTWKAVDNP